MPKSNKQVQDQAPTTPVVEPTPESAPVVAAPSAPIFTIGKTPKLGTENMNNTKRTWDMLAATIAEHGPQTVGAMQQLAKEQFNHMSFVKYAVKNGWYVATTLEAEQAKADHAKAVAELAAKAAKDAPAEPAKAEK